MSFTFRARPGVWAGASAIGPIGRRRSSPSPMASASRSTSWKGFRRAAEAIQGDLAITALPAVGFIRGADEGQGARAQPARAEAPTRGAQRARPRDDAASRGRREAQL